MLTAGHYGDVRAPAPPPSSWAAHADSNVAIWTIKLAPHARFTLPAAPGTNRSLYFFSGQGLDVDGHAIPYNHRVELRGELEAALTGGPEETEPLLLQGKPIGEPVVNYGPFVMNTREEIRQAILDYQRTHSAAGRGPAPIRCTPARKVASRAAPTEKWNAPPEFDRRARYARSRSKRTTADQRALPSRRGSGSGKIVERAHQQRRPPEPRRGAEERLHVARPPAQRLEERDAVLGRELHQRPRGMAAPHPVADHRADAG